MSARRAVAGALMALALGACAARTAGEDTITIGMLANQLDEPGWSGLIRNFERVYPNIKVDVNYATSTVAERRSAGS